MVPQGGDFVIAQGLRPKSPFAKPPRALELAKLHVDKFEVNAARQSLLAFWKQGQTEN